jgi:hypothetical protein
MNELMKGVPPMRRILIVVLCIVSLSVISQVSLANQDAQQSPAPTASPSDSGRVDRNDTGDSSNKRRIIEYLKDVDKRLDASLAATLAGLALAAAAFLASLEQQKRNALSSKYQVGDPQKLLALAKSGNPDPDLQQLVQVDKATKSMIWAFYFFVAVLVNAILVHPLEDLKSELSTQFIADFTLASGGMVSGLAAMIRGAHFIRTTVSPGKLEGEKDSGDQRSDIKK